MTITHCLETTDSPPLDLIYIEQQKKPKEPLLQYLNKFDIAFGLHYLCICLKVCMKHYLKDKEFSSLFEKIFKQYFTPLCFYAVSFVKNEEIARDIVHDVFSAVWARRGEIDTDTPIYPYLVNLTRNRAINYLKHLKVEGKHISHLYARGELFDSSADTSHEELIVAIIDRIDQLPERCGEVMKLCFVECKKYKEIAEELNISLNTVKTHIATGIKILRHDFPTSCLLYLWIIHELNVKK